MQRQIMVKQNIQYAAHQQYQCKMQLFKREYREIFISTYKSIKHMSFDISTKYMSKLLMAMIDSSQIYSHATLHHLNSKKSMKTLLSFDNKAVNDENFTTKFEREGA